MNTYKLTLAPADKENYFRVTWENLENMTQAWFEQPAPVILKKQVDNPQKRWQQDIGAALFAFIDGDASYLSLALAEARKQGEKLQLFLETFDETAHWPFELLARKNDFLLLKDIHLVRCVSDWGSAKDTPPGNRPLKLLFMACSAIDVEPVLDFEREEEALFQITENLPVDMEVEDSGSLEGLNTRLLSNQYDVLHLSGHAGIDKKGQPFFVMETETGTCRPVSPGELWKGALIENPPRLLFLSGCGTAEKPVQAGIVSFAHQMVKQYRIPAVLGWGNSVADDDAIPAQKILYEQLSRGKDLAEAVWRARLGMEENAQKKEEATSWSMLRLFGSRSTFKALVAEGQQKQVQSVQMVRTFLKNSRVQVLAKGFVGRRRQLQQSLRALEQNRDKFGLSILGTSGLGKSCLAGKICQRFPDTTLIILHGKLDDLILSKALRDAFVAARDKAGQETLAREKPMVDKIADLCAGVFKEKNYLLLLDDFEQNLESPDGKSLPLLLPGIVELMQALLHYLPFSGKKTQMIITSRYDFSLTEDGIDLVDKELEKVWLTSFGESQQRKKVRELTHILTYPEASLRPRLLAAGFGNPRLMEWVDKFVGQIQTEDISGWLDGAEAEMADAKEPKWLGADQGMAHDNVSRLVEAVAQKQEEFIRKHVIRLLMRRGGEKLPLFLASLSVYRGPVQAEGVRLVAAAAGITQWKKLLQNAMTLSLTEYDGIRKTYRLTPLLCQELSATLQDIKLYHEAAFRYYKSVCEKRELLEPSLTEEWIFHALECGREKTAAHQGGRLVKHLRERLALSKSRWVGQWILKSKKQEPSDRYGAFLLNETAATLKYLGENGPAVKYYRQAYRIDLTVHGKSSREVARDLNNLADTWRTMGKPDKAIDYYEKSLDIIRGLKGEKNIKRLGTLLNNLGAAWAEKDNQRYAARYYEEALEAWEKISEKHPGAAATLSNLGAVWSNLSDYNKACKYLRQALDICLVLYGAEHPNVATVLNNLGTACYNLENFAEAETHHKKALNTWKKLYKGKPHINIAVALNHLGAVMKELKKPEEALRILQEALLMVKEIHGEKHQYAAVILDNMGCALRYLGEYERALEYHRCALAIDREILDGSHPSIAGDLTNLGKAYLGLEQREKAREAFREAYDIAKNYYGEKHPKTKAIDQWMNKSFML